MTETQFTFWLQGFFELSEATALSARQVEIIKQHLALVKHTQDVALVFDWTKFVPPVSPAISPYGPVAPYWIDITCSDSSVAKFC